MSEIQSLPALSLSQRLYAYAHFHLRDHHLLRLYWTNLEEIAPGVWRSNQPGPMRLMRMQRQGIRSVLNLRGASRKPFYQLAARAAQRCGLTMASTPLSAKRARSAAELLAAWRALHDLPRPVLVHCKSGADRTGLLCALLILERTGDEIAARRQLSMKYLHRRAGRTAILDDILDDYIVRRRQDGVDVTTWLAMDYDPRNYAAPRFGPRP
ncbi:MAG: fused DSP-PTPase phosphatase/NAD kinase-like protein [Shimia sp.]